MRERRQVDRGVDQFERKLDRLATKEDLANISRKIDDMFADVIESFRKATEGHGAALDRIERALREMNGEMEVLNLRKEP